MDKSQSELRGKIEKLLEFLKPTPNMYADEAGYLESAAEHEEFIDEIMDAFAAHNSLYIKRCVVKEMVMGVVGEDEYVIAPEPMEGIDQLWLQGRQQGYATGRNELRTQLRQSLTKALEDI